MRVLIFGAGAVGLGLAGCLMKSGAGVRLIGREDTVRALRKEGLERVGLFGTFRAASSGFESFSSLKEAPEGEFDYVLVCTKSFDSRRAAAELSACPWVSDSSAPIVLCQNGWGNAEIFSSFFPRGRIRNARVITGFCRPEKHRVEVTVHADAIHVGSLFGGDLNVLQPLAKAIGQGGIPCEVTETIDRDLWAKMLYNCALNALGAVLNVPYGLLGESDHTRSIMKGIVVEVFQVMKREGHVTHWPGAGDYLKVFYDRLLPRTYRHESSMLQDLRARKPTEIEALNGAVVRMGERMNLPVPQNETVCRIVKFLEEGLSPSRTPD